MAENFMREESGPRLRMKNGFKRETNGVKETKVHIKKVQREVEKQ